MGNINSPEGFELSVNQKELWSLLNNSNNYYNQFAVHINGSLDKDKLFDSISRVIHKHEVLSSRFYINRNSTIPFQLSGVFTEPAIGEGWLNEQVVDVNEYVNRPYDPLVNEPVNFFLGKISDQEHILFIRLYAFWGDSYSCVLFYTDLCNEYFGNTGDGQERIEYRNFSKWQNDLANEPDEEGVEFWNNYKYFLNKNVLPFERNGNSSFVPARQVICSFSDSNYAVLKQTAKSFNVSVEDILLAQFCIYLSYFAENSCTVGYLPGKRNYEELNNTFGLVSKALPITFNTGEVKSFGEAVVSIEQVKGEVMSFGDFFHFGLTKSTNDASGSFFPYCFEYLPLDNTVINSGNNISINVDHIYSITSPFVIKLFCLDYGDSLSLELYYDQNKLNACDVDLIISQLNERFQQLTGGHLNVQAVTVKESELIASVNSTASQINTSKTIVELFEEQVAFKPHSIAVSFEKNVMTYLELNEQSDLLAHYLINTFDIRPGHVIAIMLDRSQWMIICLLAVMKAGAAYVPIDPVYPFERIAYILKDCEAQLLITEKSLFEESASSATISTLYISEYNAEKNKLRAPGNGLLGPANADAPAYIIYTSGSTGNPKGCIINHRNLSNYIQWAREYYFKGGEWGNCSLITSVSFDLSVTCLYIPLVTGNRLFIGANKEITELLHESFANPEIDTIKLTPSHLLLLKGIDIPATGIKIIICGGEQLTFDHLNAIWNINKEIRVYNEYGPTETTVGSVVKELKKEDETVLIGKPIANTQIYILNESKDMVPVGVAGEIYIAGSGLGTGYFKKPKLTSEKFILSPFNNKERLYKTGDAGRWLPDGNIEYIGRKDNQIKILGFRIEPGEIETILQEHTDIEIAVVTTKENKEREKELVAFLTGNEALNSNAVRSYLSTRLPAYMVPVHYYLLKTFPLTPNGKIDRKKLSVLAAEAMATGAEYIAARNETEEKLVVIWQEVLGKDKIGIKDNFFDLGGNSIKLIKMVGLLNKRMDKKISVITAFKYPSVEKLSDYFITDSNEENKVPDDGDENSVQVMDQTLALLNEHR